MNISIVLDILILAVVAFFIVLSSKQGFVKTFIGFVGCFAALILSVVLSWAVSDLIYGTFVRPSLVSSVDEQLDSKAFTSVAEMINEATEAMPDFIVKMADSRGAEKNTGEIAKELSMSKRSPSEIVVDTVAKPIVTGIIQTLSMIILFILGLIAVKIIARILNKIFSGKYLGTLNGFLGGIIGIPKGVIFAVLITWVIGFYLSTSESGLFSITEEMTESTYIFRILNSFNPLIK